MIDTHPALPTIIQGGMGIAVSDWRLARTTAQLGCLGVISGTGIDTVVVRRLQLGDPGGHMRRALSHFPCQRTAQELLKRYYIPEGKKDSAPFRLLPLPKQQMSWFRTAAIVASNFVEVFLAKEGHKGLIGINLMEKIQIPTLASLLGAMLAGVDVVLMGAGIPISIPGILDSLARGEPVSLKLHVEANNTDEPYVCHLDPQEFAGAPYESLPRPLFFAIITSHILAKNLSKKATGRVDGYVIETHVAGGHNAPPRKTRDTSSSDSPWGAADAPNLEVMRNLGVPFWLAGNWASAERLREAKSLGAHGVQIGTPFAFCEESGVSEDIKLRVIEDCKRKRLSVLTDFQASPTSYPFKVVVRQDEAEEELDALRQRFRVCDLGYLRQTYLDSKGQVSYRCPGEPQDTYVAKGGERSLTENKMCLCNSLLATVGLGQKRAEGDELPVLTAGEGLQEILHFLRPQAVSYSAADIVEKLLEPALPLTTSTPPLNVELQVS